LIENCLKIEEKSLQQSISQSHHPNPFVEGGSNNLTDAEEFFGTPDQLHTNLPFSGEDVLPSQSLQMQHLDI
jgi:hypothetical protein